jgi:hypothetical protein
MPFAAATPQKLGKYLGYAATNANQTAIAAALTAIEAMTNTAYSDAAIVTIELHLTNLDTIATAILAQAQLEASTILPELRREYRRHCALVAIATGLDIFADTTGATQA